MLNGRTTPKLIAAGLVVLGVYLGELRTEVAVASRERQDLKQRLVRIEGQLATALAQAPRHDFRPRRARASFPLLPEGAP